MQLCVECVESYARPTTMKNNHRGLRRPRRPRIAEHLPRIQTAIRVCEMHCPICLEMLCDDGMQKLAVEIKCGCIEAGQPRVWHVECFRAYADNKRLNQTNQTKPIECPVRHTIQVAPGDDPLKDHKLIKLGAVSRTLLTSDGESGKRLRKERIQRRQEIKKAEREARLEAKQAELSVRGMQNFLTAFYGTLLPKVLGDFSVRSYSLRWYPVVDDFVRMGYYDDIDTEWRSPQDPGNVVPPSSAQVQLRFRFHASVVDWNVFCTALRSHLGCRCSMPWKYKMATFHVTEEGPTK